jgi:hypothetical protein
MFSARLRQGALALLLCSLIGGVTLSPAQAEERSLMYTLGKYTAYASHCGLRNFVTELHGRYGSVEDFKIGRRQNDLQKYDRVKLACGKLEQTLEGFLEKVRAAEAK